MRCVEEQSRSSTLLAIPIKTRPALKMARKHTGKLVEIDGRTLEGGGQLLRISLCTSALTGTPVRIKHVRGNRPGGGGLRPQHLACVRWLAHACNAHVEGAEKSSKILTFVPGEVNGLSPAFIKRRAENGSQFYESRIDIETMGATALALQAILPFILFTEYPTRLPVRLTLTGGTNVSSSPSSEYVAHVLLPMLRSIGLPEMKMELVKRGMSHSGTSMGEVVVEIPPREQAVLPAFQLWPQQPASQPRKPTQLEAFIIAPTESHDAFRTALRSSVTRFFSSSGKPPVETAGTDLPRPGRLTITTEDSHHPKRFYCIVVATVPFDSTSARSYKLARDWLFDRKGSSASKVVREMAERVVGALTKEWQSGACVDEHMRDQVVIFQALAKEGSRIFAGQEHVQLEGSGCKETMLEKEPSLHARTAEWIASELLGAKFDGHGVCEGVAFENRDSLRRGNTERQRAASALTALEELSIS